MADWENRDIFLPVSEGVSRALRQSALSANELPEWWEPAFHRISFLMKLPENWDSYGANKIDIPTAYYAVKILQQIARPDIPSPSIVPTVNGYLQFEWHANGVDLEFEVISPTHINVSYENAGAGIEWEQDLDYNLTPITEVLPTLIEDPENVREMIGHA